MEGEALIQNLFEDYSYAEYATSKTEREPQRRREKRASKLDVLYRPTVPFGCVAGTQRTVT